MNKTRWYIGSLASSLLNVQLQRGWDTASLQ